MRKWACIAALAAFAAVAATAGSAVAKAHHPACPSRSQVAHLPRWRPGGLLRADVDGDGRPDTVTVHLARWADGRCAFYLRVATARRAYNLSLGHWLGDLGKDQYNAPIRTWPFRIPAVGAVVDLGGQGNLIALTDNEGAANDFVRLIGLANGRFRFLPIGRYAELSLGGSEDDQARATCARGGPLRTLGLDNVPVRHHPKRWTWSFSSVTYSRRGWRFVAVAHRALYGSYREMSQAVATCSVASKRFLQ